MCVQMCLGPGCVTDECAWKGLNAGKTEGGGWVCRKITKTRTQSRVEKEGARGASVLLLMHLVQFRGTGA